MNIQTTTTKFRKISENMALHFFKISEQKDKVQIPKKALKNGRVLHLLTLDDILYIEADSNYSTIFFVKGKTLTSKTLKYWEEKMNHSSFLRCHSKYLINLDNIDHMDFNHHQLTLKGGKKLPISRRKVSEIKNLYSHF